SLLPLEGKLSAELTDEVGALTTRRLIHRSFLAVPLPLEGKARTQNVKLRTRINITLTERKQHHGHHG
ncbi:MAG: hypothetical protein J6P98_01370, partial [Clostridia bacterium]|nr:hypothetical protein [Clostridia bacterium]